MHSTPCLRIFSNIALKMVSMFVWLTMALSCPFEEDLALPLSTRLLQVIDGEVSLALCPQVVSSSSTLLIFWEASHLCGLLCPPVYLLGHFPSLRHVQGVHPQEVGFFLRSVFSFYHLLFGRQVLLLLLFGFLIPPLCKLYVDYKLSKIMLENVKLCRPG